MLIWEANHQLVQTCISHTTAWTMLLNGRQLYIYFFIVDISSWSNKNKIPFASINQKFIWYHFLSSFPFSLASPAQAGGKHFEKFCLKGSRDFTLWAFCSCFHCLEKRWLKVAVALESKDTCGRVPNFTGGRNNGHIWANCSPKSRTLVLSRINLPWYLSMLIQYADLFIYLTVSASRIRHIETCIQGGECKGSPHNPSIPSQGKLCAAVRIHHFKASVGEKSCHCIWITSQRGPVFINTALTQILYSLPVAAETQFWRTGMKASAEKWDSREKLWEQPHLWRLNVEWKHWFVSRLHWKTWSRKSKAKTWLSIFIFYFFKISKEVSLTLLYFLTKLWKMGGFLFCSLRFTSIIYYLWVFLDIIKPRPGRVTNIMQLCWCVLAITLIILLIIQLLWGAVDVANSDISEFLDFMPTLITS